MRREFVSGTLSGATLKVALGATAGGMAIPAIIFISFAPEAARNGWVAVVATDIALVSAVTALGGFRNKVRVLLLTVAVLDDLGGVLALATTGQSPKLIFILLAILTFAIGFVVPHFDPDNPSLGERVEEAIHPYVAAILLPAFVFLHTLIPVRIPDGAPADLIVITMVAIVVGKTIGIGGVLAVMRKMAGISIFEALAVGFAAAAALTVALIGVDATLKDSIYEDVVGLGILGATAIAVVLGIAAGRLAKGSRQE